MPVRMKLFLESQKPQRPNFFKVFTLACKSMLLKLYLKDRQVSYKHYPKIGSSKNKIQVFE